jgi:hypothetical protein
VPNRSLQNRPGRLAGAARLAPLAFVALLTIALGGCATYSEKMAAASQTVKTGDYEGGLRDIDKVLKVDPGGLPKDWNSEETLAVLERGTLLQALTRWSDSARDFGAADKQLDFLDLSGDAAGSIGKYVYSDSAGKYTASPTEKLSLNAFNMLNYLAMNDLAGARVEAKRFTTMQNYLKDFDPDHAYGALGSYLAGFTMESLGDPTAALRYYDEVLQVRELQSLREPVARLARLSPYRGKKITEFLAKAPPVEAGSAPPTEVLLVVALGRVPYKVPERMPIGAAVGLAGTYISGNPKVLGYSAFKFINYPKLVPSDPVLTQASAGIDGPVQRMELAANLGAEIRNEYDELLPRIIGAAVSRLIVRAAAAEGARAAGKQAGGNAQAVAWAAALLTEGLMVAADKPDTRSWIFLPGMVYIQRQSLPPGEHEIVIDLGGQVKVTHRFPVTLAAGERRVIAVTAPR